MNLLPIAVPVGVLFVGFLGLLFYNIRTSKEKRNRSWIDQKIREIVNSKPGSQGHIDNMTEELLKEFKYQLKGYKGVEVRHCAETNLLIWNKQWK
jgi:hypothetical protein